MSKALKKRMKELEEEKVKKQLEDSGQVKVQFVTQNKKKNLFANFEAENSEEEEDAPPQGQSPQPKEVDSSGQQE